MTVDHMISAACGRMGLDTWAESEFFPRALMYQFFNQSHRALATEARLYQQTQTYDVPIAAANVGYSLVALDCNVIDILPRTVDYLDGSTWRQLHEVQKEEAEDPYTLRNSGSGGPVIFWRQLGDALDAQINLGVYPAPASAVTNGLKVRAVVAPSAASADTDTPALQVAWHEWILPGMCRRMSERLHAAGAAGAPALLQYWTRQEEAAHLAARNKMSRLAGTGRRVRVPFRSTVG